MNLFDTIQPEPKHLARTTDPQTSKDAAAGMLRRGTLAGHNKLIVDYLESLTANEAATGGEIGEGCGLTNVQVARRAPDLVKSCLIRVGGARRCRVHGSNMMTYYLNRGVA